jgi:hypothetical protein
MMPECAYVHGRQNTKTELMKSRVHRVHMHVENTHCAEGE